MDAGAHQRLIALEAVHNFRDLGGYPTADGRSTRWGVLYRADGLQRLQGDDLDRVRGLGLRTVIDLRTDAEIEARGRYPVGLHPVHYHHLPLIDVTWAPDDHVDGASTAELAAFLTRQYVSMLATGEARIAEALHLLAVGGSTPAVFHCAAGKDRTGLLAALVLAGLGVPDDVVAHDYGLSRDAMARTRQWAERHNPELREAFRTVPSSHLAAEPEAMLSLLGGLREEHGSIRRYLNGIGVGEAVLRDLGDRLLEAAVAAA